MTTTNATPDPRVHFPHLAAMQALGVRCLPQADAARLV